MRKPSPPRGFVNDDLCTVVHFSLCFEGRSQLAVPPENHRYGIVWTWLHSCILSCPFLFCSILLYDTLFSLLIFFIFISLFLVIHLFLVTCKSCGVSDQGWM